MKRLLVAGVAMVLAALPAAASAAPPKPPSGTLKFVERAGFFKVHNVGRRGPSAGDSFVFSADLLSGRKRIGTLRVSCVLVGNGRNAPSECTGTFSLPGGTIEAQAAVAGQPSVTNIAIVGGTGRYAGARGVIVSKSRGVNSKFTDDTVTFMP